MVSTQKVVNLALLGLGAVLYLFLYQALSFAWDMANLPAFENWPLRPDAALGLLLCIGTVVLIRVSAKANHFLNEVVAELMKVVWPERKETVLSTGVVSVMVALSAVILFFMDFIWGTISKNLLGLK